MNKFISYTGVAALLALTLQACTQAPAPTQVADTRVAAEAEVRAATAEWEKAIAARDLDRILAAYTDDAWQLPENGPIAKTAADRRVFWESVTKGPIATDALDVEGRVEVARSGELATNLGSFRQIVTDKAGNSTSTQQKFMTTWRKQGDGNWKIVGSIATVPN